MNTRLLRLLAASMCLAWVLTLSANQWAFAQETPSGEPEEESAIEDSAVDEGDEDAALAAARRRYGPNKASAKIGKDEIFILTGRPDPEKDPAYSGIESLKAGQLLQPTLSQAIKFSTPVNVTFGTLLVKKENAAPNYPGVYSLWLKKTASGWSIVFNDKPDIWGTMHKDKHDVGETTAKYSMLDEPTKTMKLGMTAEDGKGELSISWGKHKWSAPYTVTP